jgi:4-carboxymuconolactone decarboxylase
LNGAGLSSEQLAVYQKIVDGPRGVMVGPLRAALHSPELADRWQSLGETLRYRITLSGRLSELAIIMIGRHWNSSLEWQVHVAAARDLGLPEPIIAAIRTARPPEFVEADDAIAYEYTRQLMQVGCVDDATYAEAHTRFGTLALVELTALIGYYCMVAMTLNAHHIVLNDGPTAFEGAAEELTGANARLTMLPPASVLGGRRSSGTAENT